MKNRKIVAILAALTLSTSLISGCGAKTDTAKSSATSQAVTYNYVSAADAAKADLSKVHVLDVRTEENYKMGTITGSEHKAIFDGDTPDESGDLYKGVVEYGKSNLSDGKDVYIICNSGKRGAVAATKALIEAGIDNAKIFTVEGGAKALAEVEGALNPVQ